MPSRGYVLTDEGGAIRLPESTTPTAEDGVWKVYAKTDNRLYFQDGAGVEHEIVEVNVEYGEFYLDGNGTATTITDDNKPVALEGFSPSHIQDFTFVASKNGVITDTANNSGTLRITDVAHGLVTGDIVTINGLATAAQNGITAITRIDNDTFDCDDISFVTASETGTWQMGSYLLVPTGGAGTYLIIMTSSATPAGTNKTYLVEIFINTSAQADLKVERKYGAADIGSISMSGFVSLADADRIWAGCQGLTDATNITFKYANVSVHRL